MWHNKGIEILFSQNETKTLLQTLDILPISEVLVGRCGASKCLLFDVYKIAADFPLEIALFGTINFVPSKDSEILVEPKFLSKLTRKNFRGFALRCILVVRSLSHLVDLIVNLIFLNIESDSVSGSIHFH